MKRRGRRNRIAALRALSIRRTRISSLGDQTTMRNRRYASKGDGKWHAVAVTFCLTAFAIWTTPIPTFAQDAAQIAVGQDAWSKAGCASCHGDSGAGGSDPDYPAGPSLRTSPLDRTGLIETISCGRPGTQMPAWLKGAYTVTGCYGQPPGPPPPRTSTRGLLDADQIAALADFIITEFQKK